MSQVEKITCREWSYFSASGHNLSNELVDKLDQYSKRLKCRINETVLTRTVDGFTTEQVVGIIAIPGLTVEILPKIEDEESRTREVLVRMLKVAYELPIVDSEITSLTSQRFDLLEILIRIFAQRLLAAVRRGLPRRYIYHEEDIRLLRGKLNVTRQITRLAVRADMVACRFDELSPNTPLNRVLKAAVIRLADISRSPSNIRLLNELQIRFESVSTASKPLDEPVRLDRTNTSYHQLHSWAQLFLKGDYQSTSGGDVRGFSLLFAMNDLFEKYIGKCLKRAYADIPQSVVFLQHREHWAISDQVNGKIFNLVPDAVIALGDRKPIVLDTKWKRLKPSNGKKIGVDQSDIYQMMAYAHAYKPASLILLYPWHNEVGSDVCVVRNWNISGTEYPLVIATIDVSCSDRSNFHSRVQHALKKIITISARGIDC